MVTSFLSEGVMGIPTQDDAFFSYDTIQLILLNLRQSVVSLLHKNTSKIPPYTPNYFEFHEGMYELLKSIYVVRIYSLIRVIKINLRFAVRQLVESLVSFHIECHTASLAFEARLVPQLNDSEKANN